MFRTTDEELFCTLLDTKYAGLEGIDKTFAEKGLEAAEKQLADAIRANLDTKRYFTIPPLPRENEWYKKGEETDVKAADRIITGELISCSVPMKYPDIKNVDWYANPTYNGYAEWTWQLSRHHEWRCLANAYLETGDERYAQAYVDLLLSWYEAAPCPKNEHGTATKCWRTIESGIRMTQNWHRAFYSFYKSEAMTDRAITIYCKSICDHAYRLKNFNTSGNWLIMEMNGLAHIGMLHPFLKISGDCLDYACERLYQSIQEQIYPDGFQYELTTGYHGVVVFNFDYLFSTAKGIGYQLPEKLGKAYKRSFDMYKKLVYPDLKTPGLNDGGRAGAAFNCKIGLKYYPEDEEMRWFATEGKEGKMPEYTSVAMPYSGMAMMKNGWDKESSVAVFMESAPYGFGHQHEDKLNVLMYAYGKEVMADSETYNYDSSDMRKLVVSTYGHNCGFVDDKGQNRGATYVRGCDPIDRRSDLKWRFTGEFDAVEGTYDQGFGGQWREGAFFNNKPEDKPPSDLIDVTHNRKTVFFKNGINESLPFALVIDRYIAGDGQKHKYTTSYQLGTQPYTLGGKVFTNSFGDGVTLSIIGNTEPCLLIAQRKPYYIGWRKRSGADSNDFEHYHAPCVQFSAYGEKKRIVSALYPSNNGEIKLKDVVISDDFDDTKITLEFIDGSKVTLDEKDYECFSDSPIYFK